MKPSNPNPDYRPIDPKIDIGEIYEKIIGTINKDTKNYGTHNTQWIHLVDGVSRGTISKAEAYDAWNMGYVPEHLKTRYSKYYHLL